MPLHKHTCYGEKTRGADACVGISLASWRHGGKAPTPRALEWKVLGFLQKIRWGDEEGVSPAVDDQLEIWDSAWGRTRSLWVKIKERARTLHIMVWICCRSPYLGDGLGELYRETGAASHLQALFLWRLSITWIVFWRDNMTGHKKSQSFLWYVNDKFLGQMIEELGLVLVLTNGWELVGNAVLQGRLYCCEHKVVELEILRAVRRAQSKLPGLQECRFWSLQGTTW